MSISISIAVKGLKEVLKNIRAQDKKIQKGAENGVKKAALLLQAASMRLVPIEDGVLRNSAYTRVTGKGAKTVAHVGYTAPYALYVHEAVGMVLKGKPRPSGKGRYWDPAPRATAKFLEIPYKLLKLQEIIKSNIKL
jgi:hypothetical protein